MRQTSPERLQEIRRELQIDRIKFDAGSRNRIRIELVKAQRRLAHCIQQMDYHKSLNNPNGVATWIGQKMFAESQIKSLQRQLTECR